MVDTMNHHRVEVPKDHPSEGPLLRVDDEAKKHYPAALIDLAHRCVQKDPKDRITVAELCRRIEEEVSGLRGAVLSQDEKDSFPWHAQYLSNMAKVNLDEKAPTPTP